MTEGGSPGGPEWLAQSADRRLRLIASLRFAITDMQHTQAGIAMFLRREPTEHDLRAVLATGAIVSYARPWTTSKPPDVYAFPLDERAPELVPEILPPPGSPERHLHDAVIRTLRHKVFAHTDATSELRGVGTLEQILAFGTGSLTERMTLIADTEMERIAQLADVQRRRFWATMIRLGDEIRTEMSAPETPLLLPPDQICAGGCGRPVGDQGRYYSDGMSFTGYCPECAERDFGLCLMPSREIGSAEAD